MRRCFFVVLTTFVFACLSLPLMAQVQNQPCDIAEWYITDYPKEKAQLKQDQIGIIDFKPTSLEESGIVLKEDDFQYFRISGTDSMLVVKSKSFLRKECEDED